MHFEAGTSIHATHCTENIPALRNYLNEVLTRHSGWLSIFLSNGWRKQVDFEVEQTVKDVGSS